MGDFIYAEPKSQDFEGNFFRVRVKVDVTKPLRNAVSLVVKKKREIFRVKYERLPTGALSVVCWVICLKNVAMAFIPHRPLFSKTFGQIGSRDQAVAREQRMNRVEVGEEAEAELAAEQAVEQTSGEQVNVIARSGWAGERIDIVD